MNTLFGGNEKVSINPMLFSLVLPLILSIVCFVYGARASSQASIQNDNVKNLQIVLYTQGAIFGAIFILYSISKFFKLEEDPYLIIIQKLVILALLGVSGYGISVYDQTDPSLKQTRNVVLGVSIIGLLTGLPLVKAIPNCIIENINTDLI